jgi:hypothetical protein
MSTVLVAAFSDLLNKPKDTLASMTRAGAVLLRLRRRDAEDLVLTTASRREQEHTVVSAATRLTAALLRQADQRGRERLLAALPEVFPWTRFLPADDQRLFLTEFTDTLRAAEDLDNLAPVAQLINEWKHTAEIHADPHLAALLAQDADDHGIVPEPGLAA